MSEVHRVHDVGDARLDDYRELRDPAARRRREGDAFFVAEGANVVRRLLASPWRVRSVLLSEDKLGQLADIVAACPGPVLVVPRSVLAGVAGFDVHRGVLAAADRPADPGLDAVLADAVSTGGTLAVLQGLNDHENLGAIARSARGLGVRALVLDRTCADPWYRRTVRVSMGEILHLPVTRVTELSVALSSLRSAGVTVAALTPQASTAAGPSEDIHTWRRPAGAVALVLGAEGPGLPDDTLHASDVRLRIPLAQGVDSLNVGHAAAVAFALTTRV